MTFPRRIISVSVALVSLLVVVSGTYVFYSTQMNGSLKADNHAIDYNWTGNFTTNSNVDPLIVQNLTSISYLVSEKSHNSSLVLKVNLWESMTIWDQTANKSYYHCVFSISVLGNLTSDITPRSIVLGYGIRGPMANNSTNQVPPVLSQMKEINVSYNSSQSYSYFGPGNRNLTISLMNLSSNPTQNNSRYHFLYQTELISDLYQTGIAQGHLADFTFMAVLKGINTSFYSEISVSANNTSGGVI